MARRSIHYFDRVMQSTVKGGVTIQAPNLKYGTWAECLAAAPISAGESAPIAGMASLALRSSYSSSDDDYEPTNSMKDILNCAVHRLNDEKLKQVGNVILVTNDRNEDRDDPDMHLYEWAKSFGIPTYTTTELSKLVPLEREKNGRGRGGAEPQRTEAPAEPVQIIDPNSFSRGGNTSPRAERTQRKEIFPIGNESSRREGSRRSDGFSRGGGMPRGILFRANSSPRDATSPRTDVFRSPNILTRADSYNHRESIPRGDNNRNNYSPRGESFSPRADSFSHGAPTTRGGHTGGVARGKGKLWEP